MEQIAGYINREMTDDQWNIISVIKNKGTIKDFTKFWIERCCLSDDWFFEDGKLLDILVNNIALDLFQRKDWWKYFTLCKKYDSTKAMFVTIQLMQMRYAVDVKGELK